jgi:hypothetical protein
MFCGIRVPCGLYQADTDRVAEHTRRAVNARIAMLTVMVIYAEIISLIAAAVGVGEG